MFSTVLLLCRLSEAPTYACKQNTQYLIGYLFFYNRHIKEFEPQVNFSEFLHKLLSTFCDSMKVSVTFK